VRLPEIKAVLVNLVTSVIGRRRPFPIAALIDAGERAVRVEGAIIGKRNCSRAVPGRPPRCSTGSSCRSAPASPARHRAADRCHHLSAGLGGWSTRSAACALQ
jgi:hypothetical protein